MRRGTVIVMVALGVLCLVLALVVMLARLVGSPAEGQRASEALGIPRPAIIAHRGASYLAPEETRPAFLLARELGADYLEFDIQRTKDGVLVALHDDDLSRTTNVGMVFPGREHHTIETFTFEELRQLDAGSSFNHHHPDRARASFAGLNILRIEEILDIAEDGPRRPGIYIETKAASRFPGIERDLVDILTRRGWIAPPGSVHPGRVVFQSFEAESLGRLKELAPEIPRLLLIDEAMVERQTWDGLLRTAVEIGHGIGTWGSRHAYGPDWSLAYAPSRYLMTWPWYSGRAHHDGLFVHCWTIDDASEMWMVSLSGADGIFTNRAEVALAVYGRHPPDPDALWPRIGF